jgi:hypothetical protein
LNLVAVTNADHVILADREMMGSVVNAEIVSRATVHVMNVLPVIADSETIRGQGITSLARNAVSVTTVDLEKIVGRVKIVDLGLLARATRTWKPSASKSAICIR